MKSIACLRIPGRETPRCKLRTGAFADKLGVDKAMVLVGKESETPRINGTVYLADAARYGECNPELHKRIVLEAVKRLIPTTSFSCIPPTGGPAPRVSAALKVGQISRLPAAIRENSKSASAMPSCVGRHIETVKMVLTIQSGASLLSGTQGRRRWKR